MVTATNSVGRLPASAPSNAVTPTNLAISPPSLPDATVRVAYSVTLSASVDVVTASISRTWLNFQPVPGHSDEAREM